MQTEHGYECASWSVPLDLSRTLHLLYSRSIAHVMSASPPTATLDSHVCVVASLASCPPNVCDFLTSYRTTWGDLHLRAVTSPNVQSCFSSRRICKALGMPLGPVVFPFQIIGVASLGLNDICQDTYGPYG